MLKEPLGIQSLQEMAGTSLFLFFNLVEMAYFYVSCQRTNRILRGFMINELDNMHFGQLCHLLATFSAMLEMPKCPKGLLPLNLTPVLSNSQQRETERGGDSVQTDELHSQSTPISWAGNFILLSLNFSSS